MRTFWVALPLVFSVFPSYAEVNHHGGENININQPCVGDWINVMETIDGSHSVVNLCSTISVKILGDINGGSRVSIRAGDWARAPCCNGLVLHAATPRTRASATRCRAGQFSPGDAPAIPRDWRHGSRAPRRHAPQASAPARSRRGRLRRPAQFA